MRILAFETSVPPGSVAVLAGDVVRAEGLASPHARDLLPVAEALLAAVGLPRERIELVLVGTGPGSFTGLRVAAAVAVGLSLGLSIPCRGLPSFDALAWSTLAPGEEGWLAADARRGEAYLARYLRLEDDVEQREPLAALTLGEATARIAAPAAAKILACSPELARALAHADHRTLVPPGAAALAVLAERRIRRAGLGALEAPRPLYLRPFQAVEPRR